MTYLNEAEIRAAFDAWIDSYPAPTYRVTDAELEADGSAERDAARQVSASDATYYERIRGIA